MRRLFRFLLMLSVPLAARAADEAPYRPHYVSQRSNEAFLREGPGYAYKVLWVYKHKGYPFRENARFDVWRRVTAPDGAVGWMSAQMLSENRTVLVVGKNRVDIRKSQDTGSKIVGQADPGAILNLKSCDAEFCRVRADRVDGWVARSRLWGVDPGETFR
ncbi:MAG TPA: SH3 domain-containing protein [Rhizomicrobium sp.]|nr:SH3 domain-containing protein [Rhizomicrobium sp.]